MNGIYVKCKIIFDENKTQFPKKSFLSFYSCGVCVSSIKVISATQYPHTIYENKFRTHSMHNFFHLLPLSFQPENCLTSYNPHGYCVIYSSADRSSFVIAERIIQALWTSENIAQRAVILVGNKADLARSRVITSEGKFDMRSKYPPTPYLTSRKKKSCVKFAISFPVHKLFRRKMFRLRTSRRVNHLFIVKSHV